MKDKGKKPKEEDIRLLTLTDISKVGLALQSSLTMWFNEYSLLRKISVVEPMLEGSPPYFDLDLPNTKVYYYDEHKKLCKSTKDRTLIEVFELKAKNETKRLDSRDSHWGVVQDVKYELAERMLFEENFLLKRFLRDCCRAEDHHKSLSFIKSLYIKFIEECKDKTHYFVITKDTKDSIENGYDTKMDPDKIIVLDSIEQFCCILSHNSLWVPSYCLNEIIPCGKDVKKIKFLQFIVFSILGICLDTSSCRFYVTQ